MTNAAGDAPTTGYAEYHTRKVAAELAAAKKQLIEAAGRKRWAVLYFGETTVTLAPGVVTNLVMFDRLINAFKRTKIETFEARGTVGGVEIRTAQGFYHLSNAPYTPVEEA